MRIEVFRWTAEGFARYKKREGLLFRSPSLFSAGSFSAMLCQPPLDVVLLRRRDRFLA